MKNFLPPRVLALLAALLSSYTLLCLPAAAAEKVTLQLNWYHQFQFAGYYAALEKGYYRQADLDVTLKETAPGTDAIISVISGNAEFGVTGSNLLVAHAANKPVVALAALLQHSPQVFFSRQKGKLAEQAGKRMMLDSQADELLAYLKKEGLAANRFTQVEHSYAPQDLIRGKTDLMSGSLLNEAFELDRAKIGYQTLQPLAAGLDFYDGVLFTSEQMVKDHPDTVRAFRAASLRGWQYATEHPEEIVELIRSKYTQRVSQEQLQFESRQVLSLIDAAKTPLGNMTADRWNKIGAIYAGLDKMPANAPLGDFLYDPTPPKKDNKPIVDFRMLGMIGAAAVLAVLLILVSMRLARIQFALRIDRQRLHALQEQMRVNEERYQGLFNSMDNGFALNEIICDKNDQPVDYRFLEVNPAFEKVSGMPREKLIGKRASEVLQAADDDWLEQFADVARNGQPKRFEKFAQKTCRWFATDAYSPSPGKFAIVTQEITERKQMEIALTKVNVELRQQYEEISKLQEKLREQAVRDPLTGLHNRRYLDETLTRELSRAKRENYPLCVILIDLDFFKKVNDTYGHQAGDEVLKTFAKLMQEHARQGDVACRYGGEEFMLMLPKMPTDVAVARANLLREKFAATRIPFGDTHIGTTLSIGVAIFPLHGETPDELTNNADQCLYIAKSEGRNRVILFDPNRTADSSPIGGHGHGHDGHGGHDAPAPHTPPAPAPAAPAPAATHIAPPIAPTIAAAAIAPIAPVATPAAAAAAAPAPSLQAGSQNLEFMDEHLSIPDSFNPGTEPSRDHDATIYRRKTGPSASRSQNDDLLPPMLPELPESE